MIVSLASSRRSIGETIASQPIEERQRLTRMFDAHFDFVWRCLCRLGVPTSTVDDASQQVWLVVLGRLDTIESGKEKSFLFGTAVRVATEVRRKAMRRREVFDEVDPADAGPQPDEVVEQRRARQMLDDILETMPTELRAIFILYELEEMTAAQIAETLSIPSGTVASRLRRARALFDTEVRRRRDPRRTQGGVR